MLFNSANLTYWIFLGIGIILFLFVIFSGGGEDQDIDPDVECDTDVDADAEFAPLMVLSWLGVGKTPILVLLAIDLSSWGLIGWILNVAFGNITGKIPTGLWAGIIFIASFVISVWFGRLLSQPIGKLFADFGENASGDRLIGYTGTVTSKKLPYLREGRIGQVDVLDRSYNLVTIEVALPEWAKVIPHRGQKVLIIDQQKHSYLVISKDSSDEDKWLNSLKNEGTDY